MNRTVNSTTNSITSPWVESGAMVYVAITVATLSAVIMCCTWFITHNKTIKQWRGSKNQYGVVDDEEENIELNGENPFEEEIYKDAKDAVDSQLSELSHPTLDGSSKVDKEAFTFDDSDGESGDSGDSGESGDLGDSRVSVNTDVVAV